MALARVVSFDGVGKERIDQLRREIEEGERPQEIPATEIVILHDPDAEKSLVILFFDTEDDYRRGPADPPFASRASTTAKSATATSSSRGQRRSSTIPRASTTFTPPMTGPVACQSEVLRAKPCSLGISAT